MQMRILHLSRVILLLALLALAACKWTKEDVEETTDQVILERIYREAEDEEVKAAALAKIGDPKFLLRVATGTALGATEADSLAVLSRLPAAEVHAFINKYPRPTPTQIDALLAAIQDEEMLVDTSLLLDKDYGPKVLERLTQQGALIRFVEKYKDFRLTSIAFPRITDQAYLADYLVGNPDGISSVFIEHILETLTDQRQIARAILGMAENNSHEAEALMELLARVEDQNVLARLAMGGNGFWREAGKRITDQDVLLKVAREASHPDYRAVVLPRIKDPDLLLEVAATDRVHGHVAEETFFNLNLPNQKAFIEKWRPWFQPDETARLTDPLTLARIVLEAYRFEVREAAINNPYTPESAVLERAMTEETVVVNNAIWSRLKPENAQDVLAYVAVNSYDENQRVSAAEKLTDQAALVRVFKGEGFDENARGSKFAKDQRRANSAVRRVVLPKITDQRLLVEVVAETQNDAELRLIAAERVRDQAFLKALARHPLTLERQIGVTGITDGAFLMEMFPEEPSGIIRTTIINRLQSTNLIKITATAFHDADRQHAAKRLTDTLGRKIPEIESIFRRTETYADKLREGEAPTDLVKLALTAKFDVIRIAAAEGLSDLVLLERVANEGTYRKVLSLVLAKMSERDVLTRVSQSASDPAMRIAALQKSGAASWNEIFDQASVKTATVAQLGNALAAVTLFSEVQLDAKRSVQEAALNLIRNGDEARIPEMSDLLEDYGDIRLAEDYLNSGQPDLDRIARDWARSRNYNVSTGSGSARAKWGSRE